MFFYLGRDRKRPHLKLRFLHPKRDFLFYKHSLRLENVFFQIFKGILHRGVRNTKNRSIWVKQSEKSTG